MSGINKVILIGRLGRDPEVKSFQDGTVFCNMSIATSESWTDKATGEKKEKTEWHRVVAFRRLAEICSQYLQKGREIYIEGKLQTRQYEKDGQQHYSTEIVANNMQMLGGRGDGQSSSAGSGGSNQRKPNQAGNDGYGPQDYEYPNAADGQEVPF